MMGRAALDNPAQFADSDRYFFGLTSNPCRNRRQVFERYCLYLENLYPRRCCDDDPRKTFRLPVPKIMEYASEYCSLCREMYQPESKATAPCDDANVTCSSNNGNNNNKVDTDVAGSARSSTSHNNKTQQPPIKIAGRIIGRAHKPIRNMFVGCPQIATPRGSFSAHKMFLRTLDKVGQDPRLRNCGPGFLLRKALQSMPDDLLDQDFVTIFNHHNHG